ncbi:alpha-amylase family glycosyl hydrolase [Ideonella sp. BN130291]|uniref:alpha-amylase family glycosyl hydrolase n=1 Tax=Ideonella sp. BN130291 TaxID=3112940 RepID=UPI002E25A54B|nr:alpha-amylase family glycosyl hydrolase [Ideonella sp. BN130291]
MLNRLFLCAAACVLGACATPPEPATELAPVPFAGQPSVLPDGWEHGAFMEVFVRGYKDSNADGIGDLRGLTQSLDYLKALGVKGLWLMPITRSADHDHGYAVTDYRGIEADYGTLADLDELLRQAHARGIGVIMDYVINHSAASHPLFVQAKGSRSSPMRDWFVWQDTAPAGWDVWGHNPWYAESGSSYYATFGPHMPDFNLRNPAAVNYHFDSLRFWLNRGLDGFRFDAVPHLIENNARDWNDQPESYALMGQVQALVKRYDKRHLVCEATAHPTAWAAPEACGSAFAFGLEHHIAAAARGDTQAIQAVADWFKTAPLGMATMVSNHDIFAGERLWDQVKGDTAQYRLAAATYLLLPGTPFIYYGEEVGMAGGAGLSGDPKLRTPMSWTGDTTTAGFTSGRPFRALSANVATNNAAAQQTDANSILSFYKAMLRLRNTLPSIARGSYEHAFVAGQAMGYQRALGTERTLVLLNYATAPATVRVGQLPAGAALVPAYPKGGQAGKADIGGTAALALPAQSVQVYLVRQ